MFCPNCGAPVDENANVCTKCGVRLAKEEKKQVSEDKNSIALDILGLLIPIVGLILYLCYKNQSPTKAKNIGICALIGFILNLVLIV